MSNRLANETSPYLLQHADNPVDWFAWSDEAFAEARRLGKPVLLSIGYSACHWCHVMAHESFENEQTAARMNELFVNIKVDREERPDIDKIYQTAHQLLTQRGGGWPLTMFLDPATQRPFFGGTYFPNEARYGMPAFPELLERIAAYFGERPGDVSSQGTQLIEIFGRLEPAGASAATQLDDTPLAKARETFAGSFDKEYGGFGSAPKFPHPTTIDRLLRDWRKTANVADPDLDALFMASLTLGRMADGGLFDHVGGGFARYSVDRYWQIPHFEKMLYDNGPLLAVYAQAWLATGEQRFATVAEQTADWIIADMLAPWGGFYSSRDADSEGVEGKFYVWTPEQVRELVTADDYAVVSARFGLDQAANFEDAWHLTIHQSIEAIAESLKLSTDQINASLARSQEALFEAREQRTPPGRDEKQLTSWNALAIRGLAIAGQALERPGLIQHASDAVDFIHQHLFSDGRLLASYKDKRARFTAYLDDYAFLIDAILELLQARWNSQHLQFARQLADALLDHFEDREAGGFWFTANDHETLMHRPKPYADEAVPSGNGIAASALLRLGYLLGDTRYLEATERTLRAAWPAIAEYPHGHVSLLNALDDYLHAPEIIVIRGGDETARQWRASAAKLYAPGRLVFAIDSSETGLPGALAARQPLADKTVAYRCKGNQCGLPITSWKALARQIRGI